MRTCYALLSNPIHRLRSSKYFRLIVDDSGEFKMAKTLIVAYKPEDLFGEWNYITRAFGNKTDLETAISKYRFNSEDPEHFKKVVFSKLRDQDRQTIQYPYDLGDLYFDALVFVDERSGRVELRYQDETISLKDFKTEAEILKEKYLELESKYCKNRYIETREELDEFLTALEVFNDHKDFDEIEVLTYLKEDIKTTKNFPILLVYQTYEEYNISYDYNEHHHRFTLVDDSLGR